MKMLKYSRCTSAAMYVAAFMCMAIHSTAFANHSWGGYHWARTTPQFTLKLGNNLTTQDWQNHLAQTSQDWNSPTNPPGFTPLVTSIVAGQSNRRCSAVSGTTQVCNGIYGNNGWLG